MSKTEPDYLVVRELSFMNFQNICAQLLRQGFKPQGGVSMIPVDVSRVLDRRYEENPFELSLIVYAQAFIKPSTKQDGEKIS